MYMKISVKNIIMYIVLGVGVLAFLMFGLPIYSV